MRLEKIYIDGFGIFHDLTIDKINHGLSVFHGDNEAGKTTFLAFLRAVLFGFPDGRSNENPYPPQRGGRHGGQIVIMRQSGDRYVIERRPGPHGGSVTLSLPDGSIGDEEVLRQLLGFATRDLFLNIFAFSLSELQRVDSLDNEAVKATIYSAGMGTGSQSLPEIYKDLDNVLGQIFKPGGSKPEINSILRQLDEVRRDLRSLSGNINRYDELHKALHYADVRIAELEKGQDHIRHQYEKSKQLLNAWDDWIALCSAEEEFSSIPQIDSFPADGIVRIDRLEEKQANINNQLNRLEKEHLAIRKEYDTVFVDERLLKHANEIHRLQRGRDQYDSIVRDLPLRRQELKHIEEELKEGLHELGPEWNRKRLQTFDTSIPEREVIREHRQAIQESETKVKEANNILDLAAEAVRRAAQKEEDAKKALTEADDPSERDADAIGNRQQRLRGLVSLLTKEAMLRDRLSHLKERIEDLKAEKDRVERRICVSDRNKSLPLWPLIVILLTGIGIGTLLFARENPASGITLILITCVALTGYLLFQRQWNHRLADECQANKSDLNIVDGQLSNISNQQRELEKEYNDLGGYLQTCCSELQLTDIPDEAGVAALIKDTDNMLEIHRRWSTATANRKEAFKNLQGAMEDQKKAEETANSSRNSLSGVLSRWKEWLDRAGLSKTITPDGALEMLVQIKECREQLKAVEDISDRITFIKDKITAYRREVTALASACGKMISDKDDAGAVLDDLADKLAGAEEDKRRSHTLCHTLTDHEKRIKGYQAEKEQIVKDMALLLQKSGTVDTEGFRRQAVYWKRREELKYKIKQYNLGLERIAGRDEHLALFKEELGKARREEIERKKREGEEELLQIGSELKKEFNGRGSLSEQLRQLETGDNSAGLRMKEQFLLTKLHNAAKKWGNYTITKALLSGAGKRYEQERQPGVIRDAGRFFSRITEGQYPQILAPPGQATLHVIDRNENRKEMEELSRGTLEQLYFSVRLGLIREFSTRQEPLPVIMDDIFVNFDPKRAEAALTALLDLAVTHQVMLFTCHPETCDLIRKVSPSTTFFQLRNGSL